MGLAAEVYAEQLLSKAHGLPLWIPEPSKFGEVLIGDVGYVYDGSFYRLFNVTHPRDNPINQSGVPDNFEVLEYDPCLLHRVDQYLDAGVVCSKSVKRVDVAACGSSTALSSGMGYRFSCAHDQGALLILKSPASQEVVHPNRAFRDYMRRHHDAWCEFVRARGLDLQPDHIILVRGWVKTSEWVVAAFTDSAKNHEVHFEALAEPFAKASLSVSCSNTVSMSVEHRAGPARMLKGPQACDESEYSLPQDQCVFLSYYEIKSRGFWAKKKIKAAARPLDDIDHPPPKTGMAAKADSDRFSDESDLDEDRPQPKFVDSVGPILDYILQNSDAQAAIASDDDVRCLLPEGSRPNEMLDYLEEHRPQIAVDSNMTGYLLIDNTMQALSKSSEAEEQPAQSQVECREPNIQDEAASSLDPKVINAAVVMPTPHGKGGDPPQEGEDERQTPMELAEQSPSPPTTPSQPHPPRVRLRIPGWTIPPKVLLVDDDVVCRRLSSKFLRIFGCFIDVAVDGVGAVNKMNLEKYDLVFMDIVMPNLDGVSATSLIRQFDHLTPIISMTSNSKPNEIVKYYSSGMNDILPKPFTKDDLLQKLEKHLIHLKAAQEHLRRLSRSPNSAPYPLIGNADQLYGIHSTAGYYDDDDNDDDDNGQEHGISRSRKRPRGHIPNAAHALKRRKSEVSS